MKKVVKVSVISLSMLLFCFCGVFFASAAVFGDADDDGVLSAGDARAALRISVELDACSASQKLLCDLDYDDAVTSRDARELLRLSVGLGRSDDSCANGMDGAEFVGMTDTYYKIYRKDGITYIDGILIANKTYSLPADYDPGDLTDSCLDAFYEMSDDAYYYDDLDLYELSGYRSYATQERIYNNYVNYDGKEEADSYSARPGHSEHQSGLALDVNSVDDSFAWTEEAQWIEENCHYYGFILRYPQGKTDYTGYIYEPWHIRYVGVDIAMKIHNSGLCLEEYYGITSCYND